MTAVSVFLVGFDESIYKFYIYIYIYIYILCSVQYLFIVCNLIVPSTFSITPVLLYINVLNVHFLYKERKGSY